LRGFFNPKNQNKGNQMTPNEHFKKLIAQTMAQRQCSHAAAWILVAKTNSAAAVLSSACGRSARTVEFFNARRGIKVDGDKLDARRQRQRFISEKVRAGQPFQMAYDAVAREHPDLFGGRSASAQFTNATDAEPPAATKMLKKLLFLPESATEEHFRTAFKGNDSRLSPQHPGKIFAALTDLNQGKTGSDYDSAIGKTKSEFPDLWRAVQGLSACPV
jgi:hypothetical protein